MNDMETRKTRIKQPTTVKPAKFDMFTAVCKSDMKIEVVKEYRFDEVRMWRFDYAITTHKIALEVEGGAFKKRTYKSKRTGEKITTIGGRHNSAEGFLNDMEKYNAATLQGWRVFRVTPENLLKNSTLNLLHEAIKGR
ncbi:MAG: hypothetical protein WC833_08735 [Bacteroidales bacterium]|jgi:very-short-patch-repair endonuclease